MYVQRHPSVRDIVSTLVHESSHIHRHFRGNLGSQLDEVRAFAREFVYNNKRRPTRAERLDIWADVKRDYAHLPRTRP